MYPAATPTEPPPDRAAPPAPSSDHIDALMRNLAALPPGPHRRAERERAIGLLVPLARRLARRFHGRSEDADDLVQVASVGLIKAVDGYDPGLGHAFLSYAVPTVVGEIKRHLRDRAGVLRLPRRYQEARGPVLQAVEELQQRNGGHSPTPQEIAEHTGLEPDRVTGTLQAVHACRPRSLDAKSDVGGDRPLLSLIGTEDRELDRVLDSLALASALERLSERDRLVLHLRFYQDRTQQQIADVIGVSQMQVSRILARCLRQLREMLVATEPEQERAAPKTADADVLRPPEPAERVPPEEPADGAQTRRAAPTGSGARGRPARVRRPPRALTAGREARRPGGSAPSRRGGPGRFRASVGNRRPLGTPPPRRRACRAGACRPGRTLRAPCSTGCGDHERHMSQPRPPPPHLAAQHPTSPVNFARPHAMNAAISSYPTCTNSGSPPQPDRTRPGTR
ncbi:SigB/SigF/SigG family RNA polymerase sigma factor [Streptomyces actuosus]|uniref:SigB/SigF/SigG family RNA polymerase sigma factor n=1 Tax=Streptomyces actuosus TaxID=1885 RepID=A0ABS2VIC1_STRAS|nr:SigB/SigF/SigG family RNA polymerase sigma factor [Streptomyces actuosus]